MNYQVKYIGNIGEGGLGSVRLAEVVTTEDSVSKPIGLKLAVKKLHEKFQNNITAVELFRREIEAIKNMSHKNIVLFEGEGTNIQALAMPYYANGSLNSPINMSRLDNHRKVFTFFYQVAQALNYAHNLNYIHRDLKPDNILIDEKYNPIISDWGLGGFIHKASKVLDVTRAGIGTEYYCAPEQWNNTAATGAHNDVYSLGMTIARIYNLNPPAGIGCPATYTTTNNIYINKLINDMTVINPYNRIKTMHEVLKRMENLYL